MSQVSVSRVCVGLVFVGLLFGGRWFGGCRVDRDLDREQSAELLRRLRIFVLEGSITQSSHWLAGGTAESFLLINPGQMPVGTGARPVNQPRFPDKRSAIRDLIDLSKFIRQTLETRSLQITFTQPQVSSAGSNSTSCTGKAAFHRDRHTGTPVAPSGRPRGNPTG